MVRLFKFPGGYQLVLEGEEFTAIKGYHEEVSEKDAVKILRADGKKFIETGQNDIAGNVPLYSGETMEPVALSMHVPTDAEQKAIDKLTVQFGENAGKTLREVNAAGAEDAQ